MAGVVGESLPWDFMEWDIAVDGLDPHAVGVAVKPLQAAGGGDPEFSVDNTAFEQLLKSKGKRGKQGRKGFSAS